MPSTFLSYNHVITTLRSTNSFTEHYSSNEKGISLRSVILRGALLNYRTRDSNSTPQNVLKLLLFGDINNFGMILTYCTMQRQVSTKNLSIVITWRAFSRCKPAIVGLQTQHATKRNTILQCSSLPLKYMYN